MHLEQIEINGFKSFAHKNKFQFKPGITAIVGPNGSGKSNFADAVRWVMGEQSNKTLRGKHATDIIFAGTSGKTKKGMAEVSLVLNNEDGKSPLDYRKIAITRRLYRDGEAEYFLNKNKARLVDIQELLAKSGFSQKSYSIIGQGMITYLLNSTPKERQEMFEDAAGVKHFRIKKNLSENKLARAKTNLTRAEDMLGELIPRLKILESQAKKASKKEEIKSELSKICQKTYHYEWNKLNRDSESINKILTKVQSEEKCIKSKLSKIETEINQKRKTLSGNKLSNKRQELGFWQQQKNKLAEEASFLSGKIKAISETDSVKKIKDLDVKKSRLKKDLKISIDKLDSKETELNRFKIIIYKKESLIEALSVSIKDLQQEALKLKKNNTANISNLTLKDSLGQFLKTETMVWQQVFSAKTLSEVKKLEQKVTSNHLSFKKILKKLSPSSDKQYKAKIDILEKKIDKKFIEKTKHSDEINELKIKYAVIETEADNLSRLIKSKEKDIVLLEKNIEDIENEEKNSTKLKKLTSDKKKIDLKLEKYNVRIKKFETHVEELIQTEEKARTEINKLEQEFHNETKNYHEFKNDAQKVLQNAEINAIEISNLKKELEEYYGKGFDKKITEFEQKTSYLSTSEYRKNKSKISSLESRLNTIGEIDPESMTEYKKVKERYEFLNKQRNDLTQARKNLSKVIKELEIKINKKFKAAFTKINSNFNDYFRQLFGGGSAKLVRQKINHNITDEDNNNEANYNIEIKAMPPGKKLQNINLLSGGEKSLTSIALLLSIIKNNPSPFLIFDEIDAALDESNSAKFSKILKKMSQNSQFINITHNRETMRSANHFYGVTMEDRGISKILSMTLAQSKNAATQ